MPRNLSHLQKSPESTTHENAVVGEKQHKKAVDYPCDILRYKNDETAPVEEQVKYLKERYITLSAYVHQLMEEEDIINAAFQDWVFQDLDERTITKAQSKKLIASLDGYCVQEDFDDILARLGHNQQKEILATFSIVFLVKTVAENFFQHPFWYVDLVPKSEENCDGLPWQGVSPSGAMLESFWLRFEEANSQYGRIWRCLTTRLCTLTYPDQAEDCTFGKSLQARRKARYVELRESHLASYLAKIADIAVGVLSQNPILKFHTWHDIQPQFYHDSESVEADWSHALDEDDPRLDGNRILFIHHPFVFRIHNDSEEEEFVVRKAAAVMEEQRSTDEEEEEEDKTAQKAKSKQKRKRDRTSHYFF
ncbi:hypothetical protein BDW62DRAFT_198534 [Aspergillus aurantiobrunneus]